MIFNIPRTALELPEGTPATAQVLDCTVQAKNIRNNVGYMGMGDGAAGPYLHHTFELFVLDTKLDLGPDAKRADVLRAMDGHILGKCVGGGPLPSLARSVESDAWLLIPNFSSTAPGRIVRLAQP
jgi:phosphatidylethanolamine-binding protein (PEBP) family uncharacterized protein